MAVVQSVYNAAPAKGFAGMVANGETSNRINRVIEDAAGIGFGKAVYRGANDDGCTGTPAANTLLGFTIVDHGLQILPGGTQDVYPRYTTVPIMNAGALYVVAGEDVTDGAAVYVTAAGAIVDTVGANFAATGWEFDETVLSGGIVRIVRR